MSEYIEKQEVDQLIYDYAESNNLSYANMKNYILDTPTADVVERSEYEKLRLVNLDLAETNKGLLAEHKQLLELRSKIDKTIEEIENKQEQSECIDEWKKYEEMLDILRDNIGE